MSDAQHDRILALEFFSTRMAALLFASFPEATSVFRDLRAEFQTLAAEALAHGGDRHRAYLIINGAKALLEQSAVHLGLEPES